MPKPGDPLMSQSDFVVFGTADVPVVEGSIRGMPTSLPIG